MNFIKDMHMDWGGYRLLKNRIRRVRLKDLQRRVDLIDQLMELRLAFQVFQVLLLVQLLGVREWKLGHQLV